MGIRIETLDYSVPVYDLTVEKNHNFFANDILVHNCSEITLFSDPHTTAQCILSSIPLQKYLIEVKGNPEIGDGVLKPVKVFDYSALEKSLYYIVKSLNKVIDTNDYSSKEAQLGGESQRALAIGVQGLADLFAELRIPFTSNEAKKLNKEIFEAIYYYSLKASCQLAKEQQRTYSYFEGSPASQGILQFHI